MTLYLDANVFILAALDIGRRGERAREWLKKVVEGKELAITCSLAVDEIVWRLWKETKDRQTAIEQGLRIFSMPSITVVSVDAKHAVNALFLMKRYPDIKPRDAIHASVAFLNGVQRILSDDSDFDKIKEVSRIVLDN